MDSRLNTLQRENIRRGFSIHQKVVLEIDFAGSLWGYTEITIIPTSKDLKTVHLHSRQCTIHSVTVSSHQAEFVHNDPLSNITLTPPNDPHDCHNHPELKRKVYSALQEGDEGELSIAIPKEVSLKQSGHASTGLVFSEAATPEPQTPGVSFQPLSVLEFSPIVIKIAYSLRNPVDGFQFVIPTDSYPYRVPHAYTTPSSPDAARCWVPCVDNIWEKCTWEFQFVVPRYLEEKNQDEEFDEAAAPTLVVCSGELIEQVAHPYNSSKTVFLFSQPVLTSVQHIAFAAGPFHMHTIPVDSSDDTSTTQPLMHAFCLPGHESMLSTSTSVLRSAMNFYTTEFGSYPFGSYKIVAVEELPTQRFDSSTLSLITVDLLHGDDAIEQALETRHALGHALAYQWMGINIQAKTWSDLWLVNGLGLYITGLFLRKLLGNNEYRFRLKKDMQRVIEWDNGSMPPICQPQVLDPPDSSTLPFINLKSPLVLHILDRRLGKSGTSLGLSRVLPKIFLSAISGEMQNNTISTHAFLRTCRKVSGVDPRSFAEQWIYGSGCPAFGFSASFNRKKMAVEITMRQEAPAYKALENNEVLKALLKPVPFFEGQMTIRIHEADGTPYEHVLDIRSPFKRYEVPFNTKYKRVRRNTKRYLARQAAAQAAAEGDTEAAEAMGMVDMGFGLDIWENEKERENWKVADWTEEDEGIMSGATYEWIRMDADFEWIANVGFEQPDFMWVSQLQRDRDVVAQLEAVHALAKQPTAIVSSTLTKTVLVSNYYFRIRSEAALALVHCAIRRLEFLGLFHLFKLFLRYCYEPEDTTQDLFAHTYVPKPNDFSDLSEYFVRKSLVNAISRIRFENGKSPSVVRQFLIDQLRYNDNTANPYSDGFYICTVISATACATVSTSPPERGELLPSEVRTEHNAEDADLVKQAMAEVDRYRSMDRLIPSPHNIVTIAALEFYLVLSLANLIPPHPKVFFPLTREGNYTQVRIAAFDGLFMTKWYTPQIMRYVLAVMANDPSRIIRRHVARNACQSLALLVTMGEMKASAKESEALLIEEDGTGFDKSKEAKRSDVEAMIKVLRKDREVGKNEVLREFMMPIALAPDVDHEVRWCVLKLADLLIRGVEETAPTVKLHIPPTPVTELPPTIQLPLAKAALKPHRTVKAGGPPKSPLIPSSIAPKLKLPANTRADGTTKTDLPPPVEQPRKGVVSIPLAATIIKGRPPKSTPKAQLGGMSLNDLRASRSALKKLLVHKNAALFLQPVDPIRDHAPNYFDIIKNPMDLSTMGAKLEEGMYKDRFSFAADFRLMIVNAKQYNSPGSYAHNEAVALDDFFEKLWSRIAKTLESKVAPAVPTNVVLTPAPQAPPPTPAPPQESSIARATATSSTTRPTIKLKVGGQSKQAEKPAESSKPVPKVRVRKPKVIDAPPPPYVDDGSHDILQEVIAIEREKTEEKLHRQRSTSEKVRERIPEVGSSFKRRKIGDASEEEELLALATLTKKEKSSHTAPALTKDQSAVVAQVSKAVNNKSRKERPVVAETSTSRPPPVIPRISVKGKEKETAPPTAPPPVKSKKSTASHATLINEKKCRDVLKILSKLPEAGIFAQPVDPQRDGCPTYFDEIERPMDFGTMSQKLTNQQYATMEEFASDAELVFSNCRKFNPVGTYPVICAEAVERVFKKEWAKAMEKKLAWQEKRALQSVMNTVIKDDASWPFLDAVDPVLLQIPTYFDIIPRKNARDLKLIRQKLDSDKYDSIDAFEADIDLMTQNAVTFNGLDSEVGQAAVALGNRVKELLSGVRSGSNRKRKEIEKETSQPTKKVKLG